MFPEDINTSNPKTDKENKKQTIFKSPFITSESTSFIPNLRPPKKVVTSPIKRVHKRSSSVGSINLNDLQTRNRKPLIFGNNSGTGTRKSSMLDDFQYGDSDNNNNDNNEFLIKFPTLQPPKRKLEMITSTNNSIDTHNYGIFDDLEPTKSDIEPHKNMFSLDLNPSSENTSIFSMMPNIGLGSAFDFSSYLKSVTSNLKSASEMTSSYIKSANLLDLSNPIKMNILKDQQLINELDLDLDCVMRSNTWDSDVETEDELELDLNFDNNSNTNIYNDNETNKLKSSMETQIPSLYDPFNHVINSNRSNRSGSPDLSNSGIPLKIYSDSKPVRSPNSSQGSDETLTEYGNQYNEKKMMRKISTLPVVEEINENKSKCVPHHHIFVENLKSAIKPIPKNLLNLIVESSDGSLEDATKYATEINAQNSVGIPVPEKVTELVNIPTNGPTVNGVRKSAIIRGIKAKSNIKLKKEVSKGENNKLRKFPHQLSEYREILSIGNMNHDNKHNINANVNANIDANFKGFYSLREKQQFHKRNNKKILDKENNLEDIHNNGFKRSRGNESYNLSNCKQVNWAESLEW